MHDEGYIKFRVHREVGEVPFDTALLHYRQLLYYLGFIGVYSDGIGFGNISKRLRWGADEFLITATATGGLPCLTANDFVLINRCNPDTNEVWCTGVKDPSSESMTHYVIYRTLPQARWVVHIHHREVWERLLRILPSTPEGVPYGTPEMAKAVEALLGDPLVREAGVFAMRGHEDGVVAWMEML